MVDGERDRLEQELAQLRADIQRLQARLAERPNYGLGEGDPAIYEWELNWALLQSLQARVQSLEEVLGRIDEGKYGRCARCGGPIHPERLALLPETTLCVDCAREATPRRTR
jgi:RNA polymerase-binding transcription factor DksA